MNPFYSSQQGMAIVRIFTANNEFIGTGFFIDELGGILTTLYIAGKYKEFRIVLPQHQIVKAVLDKLDAVSELALLRASGARQQYCLDIDSIEQLHLGEKVSIFGYSSNQPTILTGQAAGSYSYDELSPKKLQIHVDTPPRGLSGAPVINENNRVVGILIGYLPQSACALAVSGSTMLDFFQRHNTPNIVS